MLFEVGINNQDQEGRVKKLSKEYSFDDESFLPGLRLFSDPFDQLNGDELQNDVDSYDNECNRLAQYFGFKHVFGVMKTDWLFKTSFALGVRQFVDLAVAHSLSLLILAEALKLVFVVRTLALLFQSCVDLVLFDCSSCPGWDVVVRYNLCGFAVDWRVLVLQAETGLLANKNDGE